MSKITWFVPSPPGLALGGICTELLLDMAEYIPDTVEDVDKDQEEGDEHGHPARDNLRLHQETDPANNHKHGTRQVHLKGGMGCRRAEKIIIEILETSLVSHIPVGVHF